MRAALLASLLALAAGCENYAETVECRMGLVLDENDECVPAPPPDGGATVATCAELCEEVPGWSEERRACLEASFAMLGTLPAACTGITSSEQCLACVAELGAVDDAACAGAPALCP